MESTGRFQQEYLNLLEKYKELAELNKDKVTQTSRKIIKSGWIRVFVFIALFTAPFFSYNHSPFLTILIALVMISYFAYQIKKSISLKKLKDKHNSILFLNLTEIKALNGDWSNFESGEQYINPQHDFTYDLDIFGKGSFFQYINRTCTLEGENKLHEFLSSPLLLQSQISSRQEAIKELSDKLNFRQEFYALGKALEETKEELSKIQGFSKYSPLLLNKSKVFKTLTIALPILLFASLLGTIWGLSSSLPTIFFLINLIFIGKYFKKINLINAQFSSLTKILKKYAILTDLIQSENFSAPDLKKYKETLTDNNLNASQIIRLLSKHVNSLDQRNGMITGVILNGFLLWDFIYVLKIEKWLHKYNNQLPVWLNITHDIDALISMAGYSNNHPDFIFPSISKEIIYDAINLGHPLINPKERICNDFSFNESIFTLITGANMSGKSTFLRTIGLNLITAQCGMPVCAEKMTFKPLTLVTNMRTTDSLLKHESYFYAELKQLQSIINKLEEGQQLFIILDEILKGTNSKDKTYGSMELIRKLIKLKANGLIATHDLELEILEKETQNAITNMCFEVENRGDSLYFDYKLHKGITQNHNATFLMKQMRIIDVQ